MKLNDSRKLCQEWDLKYCNFLEVEVEVADIPGEMQRLHYYCSTTYHEMGG
jgi:hypothetical protein